MPTGFGWGTREEKDHCENLDISGRILLKWVLEN
jgi:hypothetical protein